MELNSNLFEISWPLSCCLLNERLSAIRGWMVHYLTNREASVCSHCFNKGKTPLVRTLSSFISHLHLLKYWESINCVHLARQETHNMKQYNF